MSPQRILFTCGLCAAAVSLLLGRLGRWSGREIARSAFSLARSAQAERDNDSCFFVRAAGVHRFRANAGSSRFNIFYSILEEKTTMRNTGEYNTVPAAHGPLEFYKCQRIVVDLLDRNRISDGRGVQ
ncbi:hypothetical protein EVAR_45445_1 [Eumeta japonica]|uniref:Uncharacterized protein n=1 Tax=Eumeta variegata TaxID=151549 RepID=A0A4C1YGG3_EUMVA|nr:hypothetical protein EVAR_45445_1 [Eumeta japonica]